MKPKKEQKPLVLSMIHQTQAGGRLYLSQAPGKHLSLGRDGKTYSRDLGTDLRQFAAQGIVQVVCLLNPSELRSIGISPDHYQAACSSLGLQLLCYPIIEMSTPPDLPSFESSVIQPILTSLSLGQGVLVHCRGGIGRSGLVAACVLLRLGQVAGPRAAINLVRVMRDRRCVESRKQEDFIALYHRELSV